MSSSSSSSSGGDFVGLLQVAFIVLKLTGVITWSWWLVMLPMIASVSIAGILIVGYLLLALKTK